MSHPVLARRNRERAAHLEIARSWSAELAARVDLVAAVVVGSVARGDFNTWSDIDVLVIARDLPEGGRTRLALLAEDAPPGVQPIGWTPTDLRDRRRAGDPIAREADRVGVVVQGRLPDPVR